MQRVIMKTNIVIAAAALLLAPSLALADEKNVPEKRPANIVVHIDGAGTLHGDDGVVHTQCEAPCDRAVPADGEYRIAVSTAGTSAPFTLMRDSRSERVKVSSDSPVVRSVGAVLMGLGGAAMVSSLALGIAGASTYVEMTEWAPLLGYYDTYKGELVASGISGGIGLAVFVTGLVLYATHRRVAVTQTALTF